MEAIESIRPKFRAHITVEPQIIVKYYGESILYNITAL